ncbi:MAG: type II secretion system protein GspG [Patescibacteria group bacterium]|nr:type II secretion system protein GspG [Patescibacteria group bacterium]
MIIKRNYKKNLLEKSFTLIEILVVATIIVLLASGGIVSYSQFLKQSRDAKRKADLEQIKAALEMYRSNNGYYPSGNSVSNLSILTGSPKYIESIPQDPRPSLYKYDYDAIPSGCNNVSPNYCYDYNLGAKLESGGTDCTSPNNDCEVNAGNQPCNYCLGPYGQK